MIEITGSKGTRSGQVVGQEDKGGIDRKLRHRWNIGWTKGVMQNGVTDRREKRRSAKDGTNSDQYSCGVDRFKIYTQNLDVQESGAPVYECRVHPSWYVLHDSFMQKRNGCTGRYKEEKQTFYLRESRMTTVFCQARCKRCPSC